MNARRVTQAKLAMGQLHNAAGAAPVEHPKGHAIKSAKLRCSFSPSHHMTRRCALPCKFYGAAVSPF